MARVKLAWQKSVMLGGMVTFLLLPACSPSSFAPNDRADTAETVADDCPFGIELSPSEMWFAAAAGASDEQTATISNVDCANLEVTAIRLDDESAPYDIGGLGAPSVSILLLATVTLP
ncbi:MAG: hypothetical protein EXR71_02745 [Myxococcales bacterium]|nr:hypothetical protein [Myxococcales bacterium]